MLFGDNRELFEHLDKAFINIAPGLAKDFVKFYFLLYPESIGRCEWLTKKQANFYGLNTDKTNRKLISSI